MRDYIQRHYPNLGGGKQRTQDSFRKIVKEAWDSVSPKYLVRLIESVPSSFQAVQDADVGPTKYRDEEVNERLNDTQGYEGMAFRIHIKSNLVFSF